MPSVVEKTVGDISQVIPISKETWVNYSSLKNAGNEVFVLYSGKPYNEDNASQDIILVFDWDGKPLRQYKLDDPIYTFDVDPINKKIYGISSHNDMHLVEYRY